MSLSSIYSLAIITAWPVPNCSVWNANLVSLGNAFSTKSLPCPNIATISSTPAFIDDCITWLTISFPHTLCITLGKSDFILVPLPAERIKALIFFMIISPFFNLFLVYLNIIPLFDKKIKNTTKKYFINDFYKVNKD